MPQTGHIIFNAVGRRTQHVFVRLDERLAVFQPNQTGAYREHGQQAPKSVRAFGRSQVVQRVFELVYRIQFRSKFECPVYPGQLFSEQLP